MKDYWMIAVLIFALWCFFGRVFAKDIVWETNTYKIPMYKKALIILISGPWVWWLILYSGCILPWFNDE